MVKAYILDKTLDVGTTYEAESDKAYIINKIGTTSTTKTTLSVAGVNCIDVIINIARINRSPTERIDMLDLKDLYVVIPPDKKFSFTGASGSKLRIVGNILELGPGETLEARHLDRYNAQGRHYLTYQLASFSKGTNTDWPADEENTVINFTSPAGERHVFNRLLYADIANLSAAHSPGDWSLRFYKQDAPYDILDSMMGDLGIDVWPMYYVYDTTKYHELYDINTMPIILEAGRNLKVKVRNVSGASKSPASGTSITVTVALVDEIELLG